MENTVVPHYNSKWIDDDMNNGESYETNTPREFQMPATEFMISSTWDVARCSVTGFSAECSVS